MKPLKLKALSVAITVCFIPSAFSAEGEQKSLQSDHAIPPFSFLRTKYPLLLAQAEQKFQPDPELCAAEAVAGEEEIDFFKHVLDSDPLDKKLVCLVANCRPEQYERNYSQRAEQINDLCAKLPNDGFFAAFKKMKIKPQSMVEDLFLAAAFSFEHIRRTSQEGRSLLLFLGRTPSLLYQIYEEIIAKMGYQQHRAVHLSFSGSPDRDMLKMTWNVERQDLVRTRFMVTPEKLQHYYRYIDTKNLLGYSKIYIMDSLGTGGGLNGFLEVLNYYFKQKQIPLPQLEFLRLANDINIYHRPVKSIEYTPTHLGRGRLVFKADPKTNFKAFEITTTVVHLEATTIYWLDRDLNQKLFCIGTEYVPQKWTPDCDDERDRGGKYSAHITKFVKRNAQKYINSYLEQESDIKKEKRLYAHAPAKRPLDSTPSATVSSKEEGKIEDAAWFILAAAIKGASHAINNFGVVLMEEGNIGGAKEWFSRAAYQGQPGAMHNLGFVFQEEDNIVYAKYWFKKAADKGQPESMNNLASVWLKEGNKAKARYWFKKAADKGQPEAIYNLKLSWNNERGCTLQ